MSDRELRDLLRLWRADPGDGALLEHALAAHARADLPLPPDLLAGRGLRRIEGLLQKWFPPEESRWSPEQVAKLEGRLRFPLPPSLRVFCLRFATWRVCEAVEFPWFHRDHVKRAEGRLIWEVGRSYAGFRAEDRALDDPPVYQGRQGAEWERKADSFTTLVLQRLLGHVARTTREHRRIMGEPTPASQEALEAHYQRLPLASEWGDPFHGDADTVVLADRIVYVAARTRAAFDRARDVLLPHLERPNEQPLQRLRPDLLPPAERCPRCACEGKLKCARCDGSGSLVDADAYGFFGSDCEACDGKGHEACPDCEGRVAFWLLLLDHYAGRDLTAREVAALLQRYDSDGRHRARCDRALLALSQAGIVRLEPAFAGAPPLPDATRVTFPPAAD